MHILSGLKKSLVTILLFIGLNAGVVFAASTTALQARTSSDRQINLVASSASTCQNQTAVNYNQPGPCIYPPHEPSSCEQQHPTAQSLHNCLNANPIIGDFRTIIRILSAGAGIVIVGSIISGGIQYSIAGGDSSKVGAAKKRISDAIIALIAFFFIFAFLNWLLPGGVIFS